MPVHASSVISTTINTFDSELYVTLTDMENNQYTAGTNGQLTEYQPLFQDLSDSIIAWMNIDRSDKITDLIQGLYGYKTFIDNYGTDDTLIATSDANVLMGMDGFRDDMKDVNLFNRSEEFDDIAWGKGGNITVTPNDTTSPFGDVTADKFSLSAGLGYGYIRKGATVTINDQYTVSGYVKKDTHKYIGIRIYGSGTHATFDLDTLTWTNTSNFDSFSYEDAGNGWYRIIVTGTVPATGFNYAGFCVVDSAGAEYWTPSGGESLFLWGGQMVKSDVPRAYYKTEATAADNYVTQYDDYPTLTFAGSTITRSTGSWIDDGFIDALSVTVTGSTSNNTTLTVSTSGVTALVLTVDETLSAESNSANVIVSGTGARMSDSAMSTDKGLIDNAFTSQEDPNTDSLITGYTAPIKGQIFIMLFADVTPIGSSTKDQLNTYIFDTLHYRTVFDNMNTGSYVAPTAP